MGHAVTPQAERIARPPPLRGEIWRSLVWIEKDDEDPSLYHVELVGAVVRPDPPDRRAHSTILARGVAETRRAEGQRLTSQEEALLSGNYTGVLMQPQAHLWLPPPVVRVCSTWALVWAELAALVFAAWAEHMVLVAEAERGLRAAEEAERVARAREPGVVTRACIDASEDVSAAWDLLKRLRATVRP